jgi:hypothetical protein
MADFMVGSEVVVGVNMVVNVTKSIEGTLKREIFSPFE